jgi:hypothetical protein
LTEDIDEIYRRASALDSSRPSEGLRRKVLDHAAALTAAPPRPAARARWRPAVFGTAAAAALAGFLIMPRVFNPHPPSKSAQTLPQTPPPEAAAKSRAIAPAAEPAADASRSGAAGPKAAAQAGAAPRPGAAAGTESARAASRPADRSATLRSAAETGDVRQLQGLLGAQVPVDAPDARGRTALMLAALHGQAESIDVLLAHGADPNAADANGTTPLQAALTADQTAIVAALRRAGAR